MSDSEPETSTTRPPWEGGWSRFGADPAASDPPTSYPGPYEQAVWNPIPPFRPTDLRDEQARPTYALPASPHGRPERRPVRQNRPVRQRLPATPLDYPQMLRGPTRAWWRPLLCLLVFIAVLAVLTVIVDEGFVQVYARIAGIDDVDLWVDAQLADGVVPDPGGYLYLNLSLIIFIPAAMLSIWAVHRIRPRFLSSVAGGLRWRWLVRCLVVTAPLWAVYLTLSTITDPPQSPRPDAWVALLVLGLLTTPWQAAAEEYAFRGWILQNIGAWFARPVLAFVVPTLIATAAFAAAHGSPDLWILADLAVFSVVASVLTWRTGGLEAAIVLHAVNNIGIDIVVNTVGGFEEAMIGADTRGTPLSFGVSALVQLVAAALVLWQARRTRVDRWYRPTPSTLPTASAWGQP